MNRQRQAWNGQRLNHARNLALPIGRIDLSVGVGGIIPPVIGIGGAKGFSEQEGTRGKFKNGRVVGRRISQSRRVYCRGLLSAGRVSLGYIQLKPKHTKTILSWQDQTSNSLGISEVALEAPCV